MIILWLGKINIVKQATGESMIRIGICDDEKSFRKLEIEILTKVLNDGFEYLTYELCEFETGEQLLSYYNKDDIDIILLDIEMGDEHGFDVASKLMNIRKDTRIIFVTSHENLVFDSFVCRPLGFVRKRIFEQEIKMVMGRIIKSLVDDKKVIVLGEGKDSYQLLLDEIRIIDSYKHNVIVSIESNDITLRDKLSRFEDNLVENNFVKVNKGCLVNMKYIKKIESFMIVLLNGKNIVISRSKAKEVNETYKNYICGRE